MFRPLVIRNIVAPSPFVLAPMSGVTTMAFRRLIREFNGVAAGILVSEFISVEGLTRHGRKSLEMMRYHESERPFGIQIFGYDIDRMRDAAMMVVDSGADFVDINCGCPAPKVVRRGGGCELMRQPEHLRRMAAEVRRAVNIPFTLKMRAGWDSSCRNAGEIAKIVAGEGVDMVTVHGRTKAEMYRGMADWDLIAEVADAVSIPVCGSGDVTDLRSAQERYQHGVAGLFIGRGAISNPLVFREIFEGRSARSLMTIAARWSIINRYVELLRDEMCDKGAIGKVKQLISQMCRGAPWLRDALRCLTIETLLEVLQRGESQDFEAAGQASAPSSLLVPSTPDLDPGSSRVTAVSAPGLEVASARANTTTVTTIFAAEQTAPIG